MENAVQERIQAKTRDNQLFEIFVNHFEFSPKTAEAAIHTVKEIYELNHFNPDRMREIGPTKGLSGNNMVVWNILDSSYGKIV